MSDVYLKKTITNENDGTVAEAWNGVRLDIQLYANKAVLVERGYKDGQYLADGKDRSTPDRVWVEWDLESIMATEDYETGTPVKDIVAGELIKRMVSMEYLPKQNAEDPDISNPWYGAVVTNIPE